MTKIKDILAREVLDSRGFPTVEVEIFLEGDFKGRAIVPSGASTGEGEALELRDGDPKRYLGKGVLKAVKNVRELIRPALLEKANWSTVGELDCTLCGLDGTPNKSKLGANAILAVSMAFTKALAAERKCSLAEILSVEMGRKSSGVMLPVPLMNILNGGKHADNGLAIQEFMIVPIGFDRFSEALRSGAEVFHHLKKILHEKHLATSVGDEGGFAPQLKSSHPHAEAMDLILMAIEKAGYKAGEQIALALDSAASEFCKVNKESHEVTYQFEGKSLSSEQMQDIYVGWSQKYPLISVEDGLGEHDWKGWGELTKKLGAKLQLVGDDLFVTNPEILKKGIEKKVANAILIKLNQIGTVSETLAAMKMAEQAKYRAVVSHRSGESEDTFIAELAVGTECGQIKTGSASRTDRIAKYNELLRIEERLGSQAIYNGLRLRT